MKYILITESDVSIENSLSAIKKKNKIELTENQFTQIGNTRVCKLKDEDLEIALDARNFMSIPANKLFKKDNNTGYLIPLYLMMVVVLLQGCVG